jgi:hypothetical protein
VDRWVESKEEAKLELVGALEEVLKLAETEGNVWELVTGSGLESLRAPRCALSREDEAVPGREVEELRALGIRASPRCEGQSQVLLSSRQDDIEETHLVFLCPPVAVGIRDRRGWDDVEDVEPSLSLRWEAILR